MLNETALPDLVGVGRGYEQNRKRYMRILGWVLLIGGLLLCASVSWAAPGFLFMGFGLIFLQMAEQKRRRAESVASRSEESQHEPPPLQELAQALVPPKTDEEARVDRANATEVRDLRLDG